MLAQPGVRLGPRCGGEREFADEVEDVVGIADVDHREDEEQDYHRQRRDHEGLLLGQDLVLREDALEVLVLHLLLVAHPR